MTATTSSEILRWIGSFLSRVLTQSDLRHYLLSFLRHKIPFSNNPTSLEPLNLSIEALESTISIAIPSARLSSLCRVEKLLMLNPCTTCPVLSSFLLSLVYSLSHQPTNAAITLMDVFCLDPSLARSEIAPQLFEELFLVHLVPVLEWLNDRRQKVLTASPGFSKVPDDLSCDMSVVFPSNKLLSNVSVDQATELKKLEENYEEIIDENCRVFAEYFKEVLRDKNGGRGFRSPPSVVLQLQKRATNDYDKLEPKDQEEKTSKTLRKDPSLRNGRYNPIWVEDERSVEFRPDKLPPSYPQRVSPAILTQLKSSISSSSEVQSSSSEEEEEEDSSAESEAGTEVDSKEKNNKMSFFEPRESRNHRQKNPIISAASTSTTPDRSMSDPGKSTPPKDFVCPITSNIFDDPVTLETGQTYERRAIQEWLDRGNLTCPITRHELHNTQLPKTNYVLKRLIDSWQDRNPGDQPRNPDTHLRPEVDAKTTATTATMPSTSPKSVISSLDGTAAELRHAITRLCLSEILEESEVAVLKIDQFWRQALLEEAEMETMLSKPAVVNGFMEILFNSLDLRVLRATMFLLCELGSRDKSVIHTLTQVDSDVDCIVALFKKGLLEAAVLIYLLWPSGTSLAEMDLVESLLTIINQNEDRGEDLQRMCVTMKTASIHLLARILESSEAADVSSSSIENSVISSGAIESVMSSLHAKSAEERIAAVGILLRCIQYDGRCRNLVADKVEFVPVLEILVGGNDGEWFQIVRFLSELVRLKRRSFNEQVLHIIKEEGSFSTMHTLLTYLQTASPDQCPVVASLLLQLDLLSEPRKMSIFREEAIDALISSLKNTDFPSSQIAAAETIISLQGRFSASGQCLTRAFLLKHTGLEKKYKSVMQEEHLNRSSIDFDEPLEEEKAAEDWERKTAYALVSHEFGLLFEALAEGLKSRYAELSSTCFVASIWLISMLTVLPDTGVRGAARVCLLKQLISIFKSAKDIEDRALSMLTLSTFIKDADGLRDLTPYMKNVLRGLRELRKFSPLAVEMLRVLSEGSESSADLWNHRELIHVDCSSNGEVLSIVCFKDKIFSGHSDGTIKVWTGRGSILHPIQEVREHTKAVMRLAILPSSERLYSGSLDKTAKVWTIVNESIHCVKVHEMKDHVNNLVVSNNIACFIPHGAGVKVHSWNGGSNSKHLNQNKYVKCLDLAQGKLYCGCHDNSIQEIDLATGTLSSIQSGSRKLLGKSYPVQAIEAHGSLLYSVSSSMDGSTVKIWNISNHDLVGSFSSTSEVRSIAVSSDLIYLCCKGGSVEIWCKEKYSKVDTLQTGTDAKIISIAIDRDENFLVVGTSDGQIQAWELS